MKYYVVWTGRQPGIYTTWAECQAQVVGAAGAAYKSFDSLQAARQALAAGADAYITPPAQRAAQAAATRLARATAATLPPNPPDYRHDTVLPLPPEVEADALSVDAACSGNPGRMEYRGVYLKTGQQVFHYGPIYGTNNIGEFLAIVHALALLQQQGRRIPIYSDSRNALLWVKAGHCRTTLKASPHSEQVLQLVARAEQWLKTHGITAPLRKWDTARWGECPADFGRK